MRTHRWVANGFGGLDDFEFIGVFNEPNADNFWGGKIKMREQDHQAIQDVYLDESVTVA